MFLVSCVLYSSTIRDKIINNKDLEDLQFFSPVSYIVYKHRMLRLKYSESRKNLEAKYLKLYKPLYAKRYQIVNDICKVEVKAKAAMDQGDKATKVKEIPNFWLSAMKNHKLLAQEITERDEEALKYLKDIKWFKIDGGCFKLEFVFQQPNPYFENDVLTKSYQEKTTGCVIKWHHGKDLTHKLLEGMSKNSERMIKSCESFFNFFNPPKFRPHDDVHDYDEHPDYYDEYIDCHDEYLVEEVKSRLNYDYYIGKIFRDKIIPHAVSWFTREALEEGGEFEDLQDEDDEDVEFY
ncbi:nucleosome assembly protein 1;4-like [Rosa rugosa]|uniref:nucleosome assembly protein 1;4-like n=1 Tax=Rosa rugosa TaxID=74645 RepID=UPI002B40349F|nr:nucleosome assembly protein 1;4-like [Rosa rugosa]